MLRTLTRVFTEFAMRFVSPKAIIREEAPPSFRALRQQRRQARVFRNEIVRQGKIFRLRPLIPIAAALATGSALGPLFLSYEGATRFSSWLCAVLRAVQFAAIFALLIALRQPEKSKARRVYRNVLLRALPKKRWAPVASLLVLLLLSTAFVAAQRQLPPPLDVSRLSRLAPFNAKEPPSITLVGEIAAPPRYNEFTIEFPLSCRAARFARRNEVVSGRVWVVLPRADAPPLTGVETDNISAAKTEDVALPEPSLSTRNSTHPQENLAQDRRNDSRGSGAVSTRYSNGFAAGDIIKVRASLYDLPRPSNKGEISRNSFYIAQNCWCLARAVTFRSAHMLQAAQGFSRILNQTRRGIATLYEDRLADSNVEEDAAPAHPYKQATSVLLTSLIFGEGGLREPLPRATRERYRVAGLSHLLVASGTQITLLAGAAILLARFIALRGVALILSTAIPLWFYSALAGGQASVSRAAIVGFCVVAALSLGRAVDALSLWALALIALLLLDPAQIFDIGLQLSFVATWGLLALSPALRVIATQRAPQNTALPHSIKSEHESSWLPSPLAFLLAVQMATLPVQLANFGTLSAVALPVNALALPLAGLVTFFGVLTLLFSGFAAPAYGVTRALDSLCSIAANLPGAQLSGLFVSHSTLFLVVLMPFALCGVAGISVVLHNIGGTWRDLKIITRYEASQFIRQLQRTPRRTLSPLLVLAVLCALLLLLNARRAPLQVAFLDVGQGDSIIIRTPSGKTILIDGGSGDARRGDVARGVIVPYLQSVGVTQIDVLIMTHADSDHCNALAGVMREVPTKLVIDGAADTEAKGDVSGEYSRLKRLWRAQKVRVQSARAGQTIDWGDGVRLTMLAPVAGMNAFSENNRSAVTRLEYGGISMLFTGDMEFDGEDVLLQSGQNVRATILKVGHHGSRGATSSEFLRRVAPRVAVVSCGRFNRYGHPSKDALSRLEGIGAEVFRTDRDGEVDISCDTKNCKVSTFR